MKTTRTQNLLAAALDRLRHETVATKPLPGTPMTLQDRAYTSPIWYSP